MSIDGLISAPPSGRQRPLIIDDSAYSTAIIRQGSPIPWTDLGALAAHFGQVASLLGSDSAWLDVQRWQHAQLAAAPGIPAEMGARSRTGFALRTLLRHEGLLSELSKAATTIADATRRGITLRLPSPAVWLRWAHETAQTPVTGIGLNEADSASLYIAEWLGHLGSLPIDLIILDGTDAPDDLGESLSIYTAIINVADHLDWPVVYLDGESAHMSGPRPLAVLPGSFWQSEPAQTPHLAPPDAPEGGKSPDAALLITAIPASAAPEQVLSRLESLR